MRRTPPEEPKQLGETAQFLIELPPEESEQQELFADVAPESGPARVETARIDTSQSSRWAGWDAIDAALRPLYGTLEPRHYSTSIPFSLGGRDPLDGISAYAVDEPRPHWHVITYGFSELYEKRFDEILTDTHTWAKEDKYIFPKSTRKNQSKMTKVVESNACTKWFSDAGHHVLDLNIPSGLPIRIQKRIGVLQAKCHASNSHSSPAVLRIQTDTRAAVSSPPSYVTVMSIWPTTALWITGVASVPVVIDVKVTVGS